MKKMFACFLAVVALCFSTPVLAWDFFVEETITDFVNVSVLTMEGDEILTGQTVRVRNGRIEGVWETAPFNEFCETDQDAMCLKAGTIIDGTGRYLIPGLAEMHGHIPAATEYTEDLQDLLFLYLSQGVTTVRGMLGNDGQLQLQQDILDGNILGPTLYLGGRSFNGNSVSSPIQARRMVRDQVKEGWDFLKIHPGLTLDEYNAMADEATKAGISWAGHVPLDVGLGRALQASQKTIDHLDGYDIYTHGETEPLDEERLQLAIQLTLDNGGAVVPTLALWENLLGVADADALDAMPEMKYVSPQARARYRNQFQSIKPSPDDMAGARQNALNRRQILKALYDAGATILLGSDAPQLYSVPGFSIHREMKAMSDAGIDNYGILASGTVNVGAFFADKDQFGTIAPGNRADLILLDKNPLEDISNITSIAGVMVRGVWLSREEIDAGLAEIAARKAE